MMKKIILSLFIIHYSLFSSSAQGAWTQKANFGGTARYYAVGFSIPQNGKGYIGTGWNPTQDFWEWDQATDTWTQKANFGGAARALAVGFSIGTKGYIGCGATFNDFWEWDQATNSWTQKAVYPGQGRRGAAAFSIGNKGYIGTGDNGISNFTDFWEYDPAGNNWTQKTNVGGGTRWQGVGFSIGNKGYIGTGWNSSTLYQDLWEYDPVSDTWTQKANFGGGVRATAAAFSIGTKGYIGTGWNGASYVNDFWEWDQTTNVWTQRPNVPGLNRMGASAFSIGSCGYIGTGWSPSMVDFWEYSTGGSCSSVSMTVSVQGTNICAGNCATLTANPSGGTSPYTYSWNPSGQTSQSIIQCPTSTTVYTVTITDATAATATDTAMITVSLPPVAVISGNTTLCLGQTATLTASGGNNYSWNTGATSSLISVTPTATTNYSVIVSNGTCADTASATVTVNPIPAATISGNTTICFGQTATLTASGGGNYSWSTGATSASIVVSPTSATTYSVIAYSGSCSDTASAAVTVNPLPTANAGADVTICPGSLVMLSASGNGNYSWSTGQTTSSINVSPTSTTAYTVTVTNSCGSSTDAVNVIVSNNITASVSGNTSICSGQTTTLTAFGGTNYTWSTSATSSSIITAPAATSSYSVIVSSGTCADTAFVTVIVSPLPNASVSGNATICSGESVMLTASGGGNYSWGNGATTSSINISPTSTSTYSVLVSAGNCSASASATVTVNPLPTVNAGNNITLTEGQTATLTASGGGNYSWSTGENSSAIIVNPLSTTIYCVTVTDTNGCTASSCVTVFVELDCSGELYLPNAFSPNDDGENDELKIYFGNIDCMEKLSIVIYNRWGEKVFEANEPDFRWNGSYKNKITDSGVYVYYLKTVLTGGAEINRSGNVSLVR